MGVEEEEEQGPVRVQGGNQHKPKGGREGNVTCGWEGGASSLSPVSLTHLLAQALISMEMLDGLGRAIFLLPAVSRM